MRLTSERPPAPAERLGRLPLLAAFLDALFPGRCLLCGEWLLPGNDRVRAGTPAVAPGDIPLCSTCAASLAPLRGEAKDGDARGRCSRCGTRLVSEHLTCLRCRDADFRFASNVALFAYAGSARELIGRLKFEGRSRVAPFFAARAYDELREWGDPLPIVPVPPRPGRRTPDAVELVARTLERRHGLRILRLLARTGGSPQKSLDLRQRRENLRGRIGLSQGGRGEPVPHRAVILDDVFTTGATLDACARVLLDAGCAEVRGLTLVIEE